MGQSLLNGRSRGCAVKPAGCREPPLALQPPAAQPAGFILARAYPKRSRCQPHSENALVSCDLSPLGGQQAKTGRRTVVTKANMDGLYGGCPWHERPIYRRIDGAARSFCTNPWEWIVAACSPTKPFRRSHLLAPWDCARGGRARRGGVTWLPSFSWRARGPAIVPAEGRRPETSLDRVWPAGGICPARGFLPEGGSSRRDLCGRCTGKDRPHARAFREARRGSTQGPINWRAPERHWRSNSLPGMSISVRTERYWGSMADDNPASLLSVFRGEFGSTDAQQHNR